MGVSSPEKAGVGGSTPSLATMLSKHLVLFQYKIKGPVVAASTHNDSAAVQNKSGTSLETAKAPRFGSSLAQTSAQPGKRTRAV
jgi:hypothetical protein